LILLLFIIGLEMNADHHPELLRQVRAIDFNSETLRELRERGVAGTFGDLATTPSPLTRSSS
jgi:hypothetical protein